MDNDDPSGWGDFAADAEPQDVDTYEARLAASRARAAELLPPSPEEVAEHEQRARENRIARIVAGEPTRLVPRYSTEQEIVRKTRDSALQVVGPHGRPDGSRPAAPECSPGAAGRTPDEERLLATWAEHSANIVSMRPAEAVREIMRAVGGLAIATHRKHARLEAKITKLKKRLAKLKRTAKAGYTAKASDRPRIRVKAGRLRVVP